MRPTSCCDCGLVFHADRVLEDPRCRDCRWHRFTVGHPSMRRPMPWLFVTHRNACAATGVLQGRDRHEAETVALDAMLRYAEHRSERTLAKGWKNLEARDTRLWLLTPRRILNTLKHLRRAAVWLECVEVPAPRRVVRCMDVALASLAWRLADRVVNNSSKAVVYKRQRVIRYELERIVAIPELQAYLRFLAERLRRRKKPIVKPEIAEIFLSEVYCLRELAGVRRWFKRWCWRTKRHRIEMGWPLSQSESNFLAVFDNVQRGLLPPSATSFEVYHAHTRARIHAKYGLSPGVIPGQKPRVKPLA